MAFACVVVTPEQQVLSESLTQAIIPAADGLLGILTDRAPVLAKLAKGPLRLDLASGQTRTFQIDGGVAQMKDNKLTVLTQSAAEQGKV
jgi:F-type H+-transporting ATPase subunit epsilon